MAQVDMGDDILLIAHSLGADLAVYLTSVYDKITHLGLLEGGYINMDKICPLNVEIEDSLNYLQTNVYERLKKAVITEKQSSAVWSENLERAAKESFVFDKVQKHWHLSLSEKLMTHLLTIRRQAFRNLSFLKNKNVILFIPEINKETPIWKKRAIQTIPNLINLIEMTSCSHSLYMEKPKEIAVLLEDKMKIRSLF
ncbi:alpha/beta hydrolase [Streptococcus anginosus]|uniref:alpha/beta hydrolase n=1 Tax=Streptococcus anginosus TaxID=1328 RepID=UPI0021AB7085|nr:alpha/beta hydrolase [Streptococcus anginosus]